MNQIQLELTLEQVDEKSEKHGGELVADVLKVTIYTLS